MRFYLPHFEKQLTGSPLQSTNCGAASGAMLTDQATLGLKDPTPEHFRRLTGDMEGGLTISGITNAMERLGVPVESFDFTDALHWPALLSMLKAGRFAVVSGDYDSLPRNLKGDKDFKGLHSVMYQAVQPDKVRVGDPLNDGRRPGIPKGWITWPIYEAEQYVERFANQFSGGIYAVVMRIQKVEARVKANVRLHPDRTAFVIATIAGRQRLTTGGTEQGEAIGGNKTWFRVWAPSASQVGYIHSSVVRRT